MLSPSTCTTRPSMGGNAVTTSWRIRPNVAPTWSAIPAWAGSASSSAASASATAALESVAAELKSAAAELEDNRRLVDTEDLPQRVADLPEGHLRPDGAEDERDEVGAAAGSPVQDLERARRGLCVPGAPEAIQALGHRGADRRIDLEEAARRRLVHDELVDAHDDARFRLETLLVAVCGLLDLALHEANGADGAAEAVDLGDVGFGLLFDPAGHGFHRVGTSQRVRGVGDAGLVTEHLLGAERDTHGGLGRQRQGFVHRVRVQRLAAAEDSGQGLHGHPHDVVLGLLGGERAARRLRVEAQHGGARVPGPEALRHDPRPEAAGCAK